MNTAKQVTVEQVENGFIVRKGDKSWVCSNSMTELAETISLAFQVDAKALKGE